MTAGEDELEALVIEYRVIHFIDGALGWVEQSSLRG